MKKTALILLWLVVGCLVVPGQVWADVEEEVDTSSHIPRSVTFERREVVVTHQIVVAPEQVTYDQLGAVAFEQEVMDAIAYTNQIYANNEIPIQYSLLRIDPPFDITTPTVCGISEAAGKYFPDLYCNHPFSYIYVVVDNNFPYGGSQAKLYKSSFRWVGSGNLFDGTINSDGVFAHETGHMVGLLDLYIPRIVFSSDNHVNGETYLPFVGDLMYSHEETTFLPWSREILYRQPDTLPADFTITANDQPQDNYMKFVGTNGCPVEGVVMSLYEAEQGNPQYTLENVVDFSGVSNQYGRLYWGENILAGNPRKLFLIKMEKDGVVEYVWDNYTSMNFAYWAGQTLEAEYTYNFSVPGVCGPSPPPTMAGDVDKDGDVDWVDILREVEFLVSEVKGVSGDLNGDGQVDALDYGVVVRDMGR